MQINIRQCDDWIAVYKDGHQVWANHSCPLTEGLEALGIPFDYLDLYDEIDDLGNLPDGSDPFPDDIVFEPPEGIHVERIR